MKQEKKFDECCICCCFPSGSFNMECSIPVSGYTPGQTIAAAIRIVNQSSLNVDLLKLQLIKVWSYHVTTLIKTMLYSNYSILFFNRTLHMRT